MEPTLLRTMRGADTKQSSMLMLMSPETRVIEEHAVSHRLLEALGAQPSPVRLRPVASLIVDAIVAQQELEHAMLVAAAIFTGVLATPDEIAQGLLGRCGDADGSQLARTQQAREHLRVATVGLDPIARTHGNERRSDHLAVHTQLRQVPLEHVAAATRLVRGVHLILPS